MFENNLVNNLDTLTGKVCQIKQMTGNFKKSFCKVKRMPGDTKKYNIFAINDICQEIKK